MWYGVIDSSFSVTPLSLGRAPFIIQEAHPCAARGPRSLPDQQAGQGVLRQRDRR